MIKFFRTIRQKLLQEKKFSRYLLYALGEIILVVIGILIAININNRNDDKKLRTEEIKYYTNIKKQLVEDDHALHQNKAFNQYYDDQFRFAQRLISNNDRNHMDSLGTILINLLEYSNFHKSSNIYESLVSSGEIKLLNNQPIKENLRHLEETYIYMNLIEESHFEVIKDLYLDLIEWVQFNSHEIVRTDQVFTYQFENRIMLIRNIMEEKEQVYDLALDRIDTIVHLIDEECQ